MAEAAYVEGHALGLDLGQASDPSALSIVEAQNVPVGPEGRKAEHNPHSDWERHYHVRQLYRWPLGTPYPQIVRDVVHLCAGSRAQLVDPILAIDGTGVGRAVVDMFRTAEPEAELFPIWITGASAGPHFMDGYWRVPKQELVGTLQTYFQRRQLKIPEALPEAKSFTDELTNFRVKVTVAAHETYEALRSGQHDDLVLSVACAVWAAEQTWPPDVEGDAVPVALLAGPAWRRRLAGRRVERR